MSKILSNKFVDFNFVNEIKSDNYQFKNSTIDGVKFIELNKHTSDDGYFIEIARLHKKSTLKQFPHFSISQLSYSVTIPNTIKAWHLHFKQDDLWFVPPQNKILIGLSDIRNNSTTKGNLIRKILGGFNGSLIFIPKGVAHGYKNISKSKSAVIYFSNFVYNAKNPDEHNLQWDAFGVNFWEIKKA